MHHQFQPFINSSDVKCSDGDFQDKVIRAGPPLLFSCSAPVRIGDTFTVAAGMFAVVGLLSKSEYLQRQRKLGRSLELNSECPYFFEAVTD